MGGKSWGCHGLPSWLQILGEAFSVLGWGSHCPRLQPLAPRAGYRSGDALRAGTALGTSSPALPCVRTTRGTPTRHRIPCHHPAAQACPQGFASATTPATRPELPLLAVGPTVRDVNGAAGQVGNGAATLLFPQAAEQQQDHGAGERLFLRAAGSGEAVSAQRAAGGRGGQQWGAGRVSVGCRQGRCQSCS